MAGLHDAYRAAMNVSSSSSISSSSSSNSSNSRGGGEGGREEEEEVEEVSPRLAAESGLRSLNYQSAVLLLEEQLLRGQGMGVGGRGGGGRSSAYKKGGKHASPSSRRDSSSSASSPPSSLPSSSSSSSPGAWLELARLYRALGEGDVLRGIVEKAVLEEEGEEEGEEGGERGREGGKEGSSTRRALACELEGDWEEALKGYSILLQEHEGAAREGGREAGAEVVAMWEARRRECQRRLGSWDALRDEAENTASGSSLPTSSFSSSGTSYDRLWQYEQARQGGREGGGGGGGGGEGLLSNWIESVMHLFPQERFGDGGGEGGSKDAMEDEEEEGRSRRRYPGLRSREADLLSLTEDDNDARRQWLESTHPSLLATAHLFLGDNARALSTVVSAYRIFLQGWGGLHPAAAAARLARLEGLEYLVEMEEALTTYRAAASFSSSFSSSLSSSSLPTSLPSTPQARLLLKWQRARAPVMETDPPPVWSDIGMLREWCLATPVEKEGGREGGRGGGGVEVLAFRAERLRHHLKLWREAAEAAVGRWGEGGVAGCFWQKAKKAYKTLDELVRKQEGREGGRVVGVVPDMVVAQVRIISELDKLKMRRALGEGGREGEEVVGKVLWSRTAKALRQVIVNGKASISPYEWVQVQQLKAEWFELAYGMLVPGGGVGEGGTEGGEEFLQVVATKYRKVWKGGDMEEEVDAVTLRQEWLLEAYDGYRAVLERGEEAEEVRLLGGPKAAARAAVKFAGFCDTLARERGEDLTREGEGGGGGGSAAFTPSALAAQAVQHYLRALAWAPGEAPQALPRIVDMIRSKSTEAGSAACTQAARQALQAHASSVPTWAFLPAASQLLAGLDAPEVDVVLPLLTRLAQAYPQALFFSFRVTKEGLSPVALVRAHELTRLLADPLLERFAENLALLVHPQTFWKGIVSRLSAMFREKVDVAQIRRVYVAWRNALTAATEEDRGLYPKGWMKNELAKLLDPVVGRKGELLSLDTFRKVVGNAQLEAMEELKGSHERLEKYSVWLARYQMVAGQGGTKIEVPGQYEGQGGRAGGPPRPELHAHVVSVDPVVLTLSSKQRPKKVVFHGDDERSYAFLVKGGEDTRNDERIEQLFEAMNGVMAADGACAQARLSCRTYKIVPVSSTMGLIEWCAGTVVLKDVIRKGHAMHMASVAAGGRSRPGSGGGRGEGEGREVDFYSQLGNQYVQIYHDTKMYHDRYSKLTPRDASEKFAAFHARVPWDCLRRYLLMLAPAPESFLTVRATFAKSLAAFSICSYIAGVGDRHLENFLLDTRTGSLVGIDFGVAFGLGASALPVPELIPFRLTRQMLNVLQPLDSEVSFWRYLGRKGGRPVEPYSFPLALSKSPLCHINHLTPSLLPFFPPSLPHFSPSAQGLLKTAMQQALRALRDGKDLLLSTLELYLLDPVVDWQGAAAAKGEKEELSSPLFGTDGIDTSSFSSTASSWEPLRKILLARAKLEGANPVDVLHRDLEKNLHVIKKFNSLGKIMGVVKGEADRPRARLRRRKKGRKGDRDGKEEMERLTVAEQVEVLVDLATDPNVLMRQYVGLATYI